MAKAGHILDDKTGEFVLPIDKPAAWDAAMRATIKRIEKEWFLQEARSRWQGRACLRRMPTDLWNELIDALPRCVCGRAIAPIRAMRQRNHNPYYPNAVLHGYCSDKCRERAERRKAYRRFHVVKRINRREAIALSEAIGQQ